MYRFVIASLAVLALPLAGIAQVTFSFSGTISTSDVAEFAPGDSISLTFVLKPTVSNPSGYASPGQYEWVEELERETEIFKSVSFTGAAGAWLRPAGDSPESSISFFDGGSISVVAGSDADGGGSIGTGLTLGGVSVYNIFVQGILDWQGNDPVYSDTLPDPTVYLPTYAGSYSFVGSDPCYIDLVGGSSVTFTLDTMSLQVIPEPASVALALSLAGMACVICAGRRRSTPSA